MNKNALTKKSTIKIEKTATGKTGRGVGFKKTDGVVMDKEEYYNELRKNGFKIEFTKNGVIISR